MKLFFAPVHRVARLRLPLRVRVAVAFALVSMVVTALFALVTWNLATHYMTAQREQSAHRQAAANERLVRDSLASRAGALEDLLKGLAGNSESTIALWNDGNWLMRGRQVKPQDLPAALSMLVTSRGGGTQRATVGNLPVLAVAGPLEDTQWMYLELFPIIELRRNISFLAVVMAGGIALSSILGFMIGWWASRRALRPLTELTAAAGQVARGDLHVRLTEHDDADLAPLAASFNHTAEALERRVRQDARFAADVSHELRTPLTTMLNAVAILQRRRDELSDANLQAVDVLDGDVQRFHRMVVDLLEISRGDSGNDDRELEPCDLGELVRRATVHHTMIILDIEEPAPVVLADRRRLDRVIANLLDNADNHGAGVVRVAVRDRQGHARVEIDDQGPGIPPELRERIFERFARGARSGDRSGDTGSGLGLALVEQHVRRHGGQVWVEQPPGGGARFIVELPESATSFKA